MTNNRGRRRAALAIVAIIGSMTALPARAATTTTAVTVVHDPPPVALAGEPAPLHLLIHCTPVCAAEVSAEIDIDGATQWDTQYADAKAPAPTPVHEASAQLPGRLVTGPSVTYTITVRWTGECAEKTVWGSCETKAGPFTVPVDSTLRGSRGCFATFGVLAHSDTEYNTYCSYIANGPGVFSAYGAAAGWGIKVDGTLVAGCDLFSDEGCRNQLPGAGTFPAAPGQTVELQLNNCWHGPEGTYCDVFPDLPHPSSVGPGPYHGVVIAADAVPSSP